MLSKRLIVLASLASCCFAANLRVDDNQTFRIQSSQFGFVHRYGIFENLDLLELTYNITRPPNIFRFTSQNVLQETGSGKCVNRRTANDPQLILTYNCGATADAWEYDSTAMVLKDVKVTGWCFSPWNNQLPPTDIIVLAGLSPCARWNQIILDKLPPAK